MGVVCGGGVCGGGVCVCVCGGGLWGGGSVGGGVTLVNGGETLLELVENCGEETHKIVLFFAV